MSTTVPFTPHRPASGWSELTTSRPAPASARPAEWLTQEVASARVLSPQRRADAPSDADGWALRLASHLIEADPAR